MSELREECYKCLNNQSCPSIADYGSILCMTKRKYRMPGNEEEKVYAHKFAIMQKQIDEKDKRIKELENHLKKYHNGELYTAKQLKQIEENQKKYFINKQKVKDKIEEINKEYEENKDENGESEYYYPDYTIEKLEELLEDK